MSENRKFFLSLKIQNLSEETVLEVMQNVNSSLKYLQKTVSDFTQEIWLRGSFICFSPACFYSWILDIFPVNHHLSQI